MPTYLPQGNRRRQTIVLVDDDGALRNAVTFSLETDGYDVRAFPNAQSLLADREPAGDCYVIDDQLRGGVRGVDLIVQLRANGVKAPAILITTHPSAELKRRALALNTPIVEKPLIGSPLPQAIARALA